MIKTKLEDQSEEIKVSIKSGLDEQNEILEGSFQEIIGQNNEELQQVINATFQNIREDFYYFIWIRIESDKSCWQKKTVWWEYMHYTLVFFAPL